ncbi:DUF1214 domain-containing protein [Consotaella salsifontis]|uniref:DUF1214 domain-containing protein n=1 Tax=Consotaella salsifontis TaxID=1365950 RepID=A0A1T4MFE8_9HYPH|nr:DUF1214 domain-containing protein [Consotaella salsifontis]SJZ65672.1 hypothetical protein SAMN05428963_10298 [Consotaella salsifontis]
MRFVLLLVIALAIAFGLGGWSAEQALDAKAGGGSVTVGVWMADPDAGSPDADPYAKALLARTGNLTLGIGEGISFHAAHDAAGAPLSRSCAYRLSGSTPLARVWSLAAYDARGRLVSPGAGRPGWLVSSTLMRHEDNSFEVAVSPRARAGNWLSVSGEGRFTLVLTLYDTPASSTTGLGRLQLPDIVRETCIEEGRGRG